MEDTKMADVQHSHDMDDLPGRMPSSQVIDMGTPVRVAKEDIAAFRDGWEPPQNG